MNQPDGYDRYVKIDEAIRHLRNVRRCLVEAHAPRAAEKVRRAIRSAEGARRHAANDNARNGRAK